MTGKRRRSRGKHLSHSKKGKSRQSHLSAVSQRQSVSLADKVTAPPEVVTPLANTQALIPTSVKYKYPNLPYELRKVGILAGLILAILILLALVLG